MAKRTLIILTLLTATVLAASAQGSATADSAAVELPATVSDSTATGKQLHLNFTELNDSTLQRMNKLQRLGYRIRKGLYDKMNEPYDTVRDRGYWFRALKHGKVDFTGGTIQYPKFIKFCYNAYKWGDRAFNSYDTAYVRSTGKNWKLILMSNQWLDSYSGKPFDNVESVLHSHLTANVGARLSFMAVSVGYTVSITNLIQREKVSEKLDFSFTCARFTAEAFYYNYRGKTEVLLMPKGEPRERIHDFTGLHRTTYGLSAYYFFNNRRYAQAAAYCFSKYQRRSAGSLLAGFNIKHYDMKIKVDELPPENAEYIDEQSAPRFLYNDYCLMVGYGHNWVLGRKWLLNLTATPSVGYRQMLETQVEDRASAWSVNMRARIGAVYNLNRYFVGMQGSIDAHRYHSEKHRYIYTIYDFTLLAGIRF